MKIIVAILIFSLIILIHELGHFLLAKANNIRVREFTLGLGPTIVGFTKGETKYCLKLFPIGGSCVMDEDLEAEAGDDRAFNNKNVWSRLSVVVAGPVFNFILAFVLSLVVILIIGYDRPIINYVEEGSAAYEAGLLEGDVVKSINGSKMRLSRDVSFYETVNPDITYDMVIEREVSGDTVEENIIIEPKSEKVYRVGINVVSSESTTIDSFLEESAAREAGLEAGDIILEVDGVEVKSSSDVVNTIKNSGGEEILFKVLRDGEELEYKVVADYVTVYSYGFVTDTNYCREKNGVLRAIQYSFYDVGYWIRTTLQSLKLLVTGQVSFENVSGPVGIVNVIGDTYTKSKEDGWLYVFLNMANMAILISANLGVMNLLPIPALDGGRILFFLIEAITRKKLPQKVEGIIHMIGFALLMILMVVVFSNDIIKLLR